MSARRSFLVLTSASEEATMYQHSDPAILFAYAMSSVIQAVVPILLLIGFIWLAVKVISSFVLSLSPDGGLSRREQMHRHRLQNFAAFLTFAGVITGGATLCFGDPTGIIKVSLPGNIVIENVGYPVIFLAVASSILWMVLNVKAPENLSGCAPLQHPSVASIEVQGSGPPVAGWLRNMTYRKAGVITLVLLPLIHVLAIPVGIFLFWMASKRNAASA
jgi:hypothetical protein